MNAAAKRDSSIDILKGVGCLVMIVAHSSLNMGGYERFKFWGGLAPALFYSAAGVTAALQAQKYKPRGVLLTYLFLILLGFSFNRITDPGFLEEIEFDIIQMIAVGSALVYLLEYYLRPPAWMYLLLGFIAFGMKFALQALFQNVSIVGVTNLLFPPGIFPIFPWLFLFFFGIFAYRANRPANLALALGFGALLFTLRVRNFPLDVENKWDMSLGYFLVCSILVFSTFFALKIIPLRNFPNGLLTFLGKNSLLFLYVHFPIILYLKEIRIHRTVKLISQNPYLFWIFALALTLVAMILLLQLAKWKFAAQPFNHLTVWVVMIALVFGVGIFLHAETFVYWIEIALGIITALFYARLAQTLKAPR